MNIDFKDIMSSRTDEELIKIVTVNRDDYQPLAIVAAEEEIKRRNLGTTKIEEVENDFLANIEKEKQVDSKAVSSLTRFFHSIMDSFVWLTIAYILTSLLVLLLSLFGFSQSDESILLIAFTVPLITAVGYYYIMEAKFQKTVAKFITKTKVVTNSGNKPNKNDIWKRTFYRLIPLEQVSFLLNRSGLHDRLSDTRVIKDEPASTDAISVPTQ